MKEQTSTKIKVLFILDFLSHGGIERLGFDFLNYAHRDTQFEFILVNFENGSFAAEFRKLPIRHFRFLKKKFIDIKVILKLRRLIKKEKIQIVHTHNIVGDFYTYLACLGHGSVKQIRSVHSKGNQGPWHKWITRYLLNSHDYNVAVSHSFRKEVIETYDLKHTDNFHTVYNGVDFSRLTPSSSSIRAELGIAPETSLLGMVGNFVSPKDQITICRALKIVHDQNIDFHCAFAGKDNGVDLHFLQDCITFCNENDLSDRIHFLGLRSDVQDILNEMDIFVFSSYSDTFGIALVEAMGIGVPCISSDIPPLREITIDGKYARLFKTGDPEDLSKHIIALIDNKKELEELSVTGKEYVLKNFSIDIHSKNNMDLYRNILED
ncbi:MAG: glycosyltransferase [Bacteroidales bacterium]|nr:glycosyltransferase [Bacteroidales bacterium]MCF8457377.1 glycosyltransferase [Bacteroidales bacterium]